MAEDPEKRKARHARYKARMAENPEMRAEFIARSKAAKKRYEAKKKLTRAGSGPVGKGKPGRLVALCGWEGW